MAIKKPNMQEQVDPEDILTDAELDRLQRQTALMHAQKDLDGDPWFVRAVRPIISLVVVLALSGVLVQQAIIEDSQQAFTGMVSIGGMILAFWFGNRASKKS